MANPLLKGEQRNTLRRTEAGALAQKTASCCNKCGDKPHGNRCKLWGKATACTPILDSECNLQHPLDIYFCAQTEGQTDAERVPPNSTAYLGSSGCYFFNGAYLTIEQMRALFPQQNDDYFYNLGGLAFQPGLLCSSALCGDLRDVCGCLCASWTNQLPIFEVVQWSVPPSGGDCVANIRYLTVNPATTFCCFGKRDRHGVVHFDFNYARHYEEKWEFAQRAAWCPGDDRNADLAVCCASGAQCKTFEYNARNCTHEGCKQFCLAGCGDPNGCCEARFLEEENPIRIPAGGKAGFPGCSGPFHFPPVCMCDCPNQPGWSGWREISGYLEEACSPVNIGGYTVVYDCPGQIDTSTGCNISFRPLITETFISTCAHVAHYRKEEFWGPMAGQCVCDVPNPPNSYGCCKCDIKTTTIDNKDWYYFPLGDLSLCGRCQSELASLGHPIGASSGLLTPTGSIDSVLFS